MWDVALGDAAIPGLMTGVDNMHPQYDNLLGYWKLNEGSGQVAADASDYGRDGTLGQTTDPAVDDPAWVSTTTAVCAVVNVPPTADAGPDQSIRAGDVVFLDGSASFDDNTTSAALDYSWSFVSKPAGSIAMLFDDDTAMPWFLTDQEGTYEVELVVTDEGSLTGTDQVEISSDNLAPTAVAGDDELVIIGTAVALDGSESSDPEIDPLTFSWVITSAPVGSTATISDPDMETAGLTPDLAGIYVVTLTVSDFIGPGTPDSVEITASSAEDFAENRIMCAADLVSALGTAQVTTKGNKNAFGNFLSQAVTAIQEGDTVTAIDKLTKSIARSDGCEANGSPDGNGPGRDWITDCNAQAEILACLREALDALAP